MATTNDIFTSPMASSSLAGNTMAIAKDKVARGNKIFVIEEKTPKAPNASGPYSLVITGEKTNPIICTNTAPVATVATFLKNGFLEKAINLFGTWFKKEWFCFKGKVVIEYKKSHTTNNQFIF